MVVPPENAQLSTRARVELMHAFVVQFINFKSKKPFCSWMCRAIVLVPSIGNDILLQVWTTWTKKEKEAMESLIYVSDQQIVA